MTEIWADNPVTFNIRHHAFKFQKKPSKVAVCERCGLIVHNIGKIFEGAIG